ncbi:DUF4347 domain-containing protein [Shimia sp.]|uniref:DUF4347 domain-containing protein n=1 Tax=Shimia sp. TaxID=1954381 RepID=UPI003297EDFE
MINTSFPNRFVVFDENVEHTSTLAKALPPESAHLTLSGRDHPLERIASELETAPGKIDRLDIVGHAKAGQLRLGDLVLEAQGLEQHADLLARIGAALGHERTIAITGCEVASGPDGAELLAALSEITGARVVGTTAVVGGRDADSFALTQGVATAFSAEARAVYAPTLNLGLQFENTDIVKDSDGTDFQLDGLGTVATAVLGGQTYLFASGTEKTDGGMSIFTLDATGQATHVGDIPRAPEGGAFRTFFASAMQTLEFGGDTFLYVKTVEGIVATNLTLAFHDTLTTGQPLTTTMVARAMVNINDRFLDGPEFVAGFSGNGMSLVKVGDFFVTSGLFDPPENGANFERGLTVFSATSTGRLFARDSINVTELDAQWGQGPQGNGIQFQSTVGVHASQTGRGFVYSTIFDFDNRDQPSSNGIVIHEIGANGSLTFSEFVGFDQFTPDSSQSPSQLKAVEIGGTDYLVYASWGELNVENQGTLTVFRVNPVDGSLTQTAGLQDNATLFIGAVTAFETFVLDGKTYLVATGASDNGFSVFEMSAAGTLTNVANVAGLTVNDGGSTGNNLNVVRDVHPVVVDGVLQLITTNVLNPASFSVYTVTAPVDLVASSDTGSSNTDDITQDATPTIAYTADLGASVTIDWGDGRGPQAQTTGTGARQEATQDVAYAQNGPVVISVSSTIGGITTTRTLQITLNNITTPGDDTLLGTTGADVIDALAGNDSVNALQGNDSIDGGLGDDTVFGGDGDDTLIGGDGEDSLEGGADDDLVQGGADFDHVHGGAGNDTLDGGAGADHMMGGSGNDLFLVDAAGDIAVEAAGGGSDTVRADSDYTLGDHIEVLELSGTTGSAGTGNDQANLISGTGGDDTLSGLGGNDTLEGGAGTDSMSGGDGHDRLVAGADNDTLDGGAGNDFIDGGTGADSMVGGAGNDRFTVDDAGDVVVETGSDNGFDEVRSTINYTLTDHVERLTLSGAGDLSGTGNSGDNFITGTTGDNIFRSGGGSDTFNGGAGEDRLILDIAQADAVFDFSSRNHVDVSAGGETHRLVSIERIAFTDALVNLADITPIREDPVEVFAGDYFVGRAIDMSDAGAGRQFLVAGTASQGSNQSNQFDFTNADGNRARFEGQGFLNPATGIVNRVLVDTESSTGRTNRVGIQGIEQTLETMQSATWDFYQTNIFNANDTMVGSYEADYLTGFAGDDVLMGGYGDKERYDVTNPPQSSTPSRIETPGATADSSFWIDDGNDTLDGREGDDTLDGSTGDDLLIGGLDDDVIFGGDGDDTVKIAADSTSMTGVDFGGSIEVTTADGTDVIHQDVETIMFDDRTFTYAELADEVTNPNQAPSAVSLEGATTTIAEDVDTSERIKVADITVNDDAKGTNAVSLSGADAALFEIDGAALFLRAGASLDFETQASLAVTVEVDDPSVGTNPDAETDLTITIENRDEPATGSVEITGTAELGATLTATVAIVEPDGAGPFSFQWQRDGADIPNATGQTYVVGTDDVEARVGVVITYTDGAGAAVEFVSVSSDPIPRPVPTEGADDLLGTSGNDTIDLLGGDDSYAAQAGDDYVEGGVGFDQLFGGDGSDTLLGGLGNDTVVGGNGRDEVRLGNGFDLFTDNGQGGDAGRDTVFGGNGDDTINGGAGFDEFRGEAGNDSILGGAGFDQLFGGDGSDTLLGGLGNDTVVGGNGRDEARLGNGFDLFTDNGQGGDAGRDTVFGGNGDDTINGGAGFDEFRGEAGNDSILGGAGFDQLFGGDGSDTLLGGLGNDTVFGGNGRDEVRLGNGFDVFNDNAQGGTPGQDTVFGGNGNDTVNGGAGNDVFRGEAGNDVLRGGLGFDQLFGGANADQLFGGNGNDTLNGGVGQDQLTGGAGLDRFVFTSGFGNDTIFGFEAADGEKINLAGVVAIAGFVDLLANHLQDAGGTARIVAGANSILLDGVAFADVGAGLAYSEDDFLF